MISKQLTITLISTSSEISSNLDSEYLQSPAHRNNNHAFVPHTRNSSPLLSRSYILVSRFRHFPTFSIWPFLADRKTKMGRPRYHFSPNDFYYGNRQQVIQAKDCLRDEFNLSLVLFTTQPASLDHRNLTMSTDLV